MDSPPEGHLNNHSALLAGAQMRALADSSTMSPASPWQRFDLSTPAGELCTRRGRELSRAPVKSSAVAQAQLALPTSLGHAHRKPVSTQAAMGRLLADLTRDAPEPAARVVTCSPDVASSTNRGGWINKTEVCSVAERRDWFADDAERLLRWSEVSNAAAHRAGHRRGQPGLAAR